MQESFNNCPVKFRTIQYQIAHRIFHIMKDDFGKPWGNCNRWIIKAIVEYLYANKPLPFEFKHDAITFDHIYKEDKRILDLINNYKIGD